MRTERGRRRTGGSAYARPRHVCTETGLTPCHICTGTGARPCPVRAGTGLIPAPSKQVRAGASPVLVEMWQSRWRCGRGEPSPGADVVRGEPSPGGDAGGGEPSPGADEARANRPHSNLAHRTIRRVCFGVLPSEAAARESSGMHRLSPGADVGRGEPSPSADVAVPVPVQVWAGCAISA